MGELTHEELIEWMKVVGNQILDRINATAAQDDVVEATRALMSRIVKSGDTLGCLYRSAAHDWTWDGVAILRVIYDAMIQGLFILESDSARRARRFLDFAVIERERSVQIIDAGETDMARQLAASPRRAAVAEIHRAEFNRVCNLYGIDPARSLPRNWFKQTEPLKEQAKKIGYESEYNSLYPQLCGSTHSAYFAIRNDDRCSVSQERIVYYSQLFSFRLLAALAEYVGVAFNNVEAHLVNHARKNVFDR